ncbi:DUF1349 domain-containing protein [Aurantimonas sp. Leaf443]|uniref:DUF1349 domain-containing protein n=1 Tax=Aurantimonas sp. Leaf443 TaxID=1736378 RepID=UPI0006F6D6F1|nr:DUF1349 domain-containing protein [Aurantimonas sp. Leaf443]KQT85739.1 regulation of enolase 1 [Aurantimonas sp. Leaf443]
MTRGPSLSDGRWLNEPADWRGTADGIALVAEEGSDFWRETHYGFVHDSGHFLGLETAPAFTAQVRVRAALAELYDQAGLMVRASERHWLKGGVEISDGIAQIGSVLTEDRSDWACAPFSGDPSDFTLRLSLKDGVLRLQVRDAAGDFRLLRLCPFAAKGPVLVGPMACAPKRSGLAVAFSDFVLGPAEDKDLHDLS